MHKTEALEITEVPIVDENKKLLVNFNQRIKSELIPNSITTANQNFNSNNNINNLNRNMNENNRIINNNNIDNNFIPLSAYDNTYHRSQYFGNSNDYSLKGKNEDLEKKYASYRDPEYIHLNYKTVSNFPSEENSNEVFDDPMFLEGKLEDQNRLKVKVIILIFLIKHRFQLK